MPARSSSGRASRAWWRPRSSPRHGIRIPPGPSSLWLDARGRPLPAPLFPGFDTLGTLEHIMTTGYDYTWFVLAQPINSVPVGIICLPTCGNHRS